MAFFDWKDEYSVNINKIDTQHRQLVKLLNDLYTAMKEGKGKTVTGGILDSLIAYTRQHFKDEEVLMQTHTYPGFLAHLREHTNLTTQVLKYKKEFDEGTGISVELSSFLKDWLIKHIQGTDKMYAPFLNAKGVK